MIRVKIQELRYVLNAMIINNVDFNEIYKTSIELDELIVEYYNKVLLRKK